MARTAKVLRYVAFTLVVLFAVGGGMFVAGETFTDPGGWRAVAMTASWAVPVIALSVFAVRRPAAAGPVLVGVTAIAVLFTLADSAFGIVPRDAWGPVAAVVVFVVVVALGFLGMHRAELAGLLMVLVGAAQLVATLIARGGVETGAGPGPGAVLGGSSGVVVLPALVVGLLFVLAGALGHESVRSRSQHAGRGRSTPAARTT